MEEVPTETVGGDSLAEQLGVTNADSEEVERLKAEKTYAESVAAQLQSQMQFMMQAAAAGAITPLSEHVMGAGGRQHSPQLPGIGAPGLTGMQRSSTRERPAPYGRDPKETKPTNEVEVVPDSPTVLSGMDTWICAGMEVARRIVDKFLDAQVHWKSPSTAQYGMNGFRLNLVDSYNIERMDGLTSDAPQWPIYSTTREIPRNGSWFGATLETILVCISKRIVENSAQVHLGMMLAMLVLKVLAQRVMDHKMQWWRSREGRHFAILSVVRERWRAVPYYDIRIETMGHMWRSSSNKVMIIHAQWYMVWTSWLGDMVFNYGFGSSLGFYVLEACAQRLLWRQIWWSPFRPGYSSSDLTSIQGQLRMSLCGTWPGFLSGLVASFYFCNPAQDGEGDESRLLGSVGFVTASGGPM